jgi:Zn-dependent protease
LTAWSFSCGSWLGVRMRVSILLPVALLFLILRFPWPLNLTFCAILFVSVLLHEYGHIVAARLTGGSGDEVLLWPLGGLAFVQPANRTSSQILTNAGGLIVNAAICVATAVPLAQIGRLDGALYPFEMPIANVTHWRSDLLVLTFFANWIMLLFNLIPVWPLDGGQMLRSLAASRIGARRAAELGTTVGFVVGFLAAFIGLFGGWAFVVFAGAIVFIACLLERHQLQQADVYEDSFMGYDFSQGYTSLEREEQRAERRPGAIARWKQRRKAEKERRQAERDAEVEQQLDALLAKIQTQGMHSLTESEKRILNRASNRYREKGGHVD